MRKFVLFFVLGFIYVITFGLEAGAKQMIDDTNKAITWFKTVFVGEWVEVTATEEYPESIINDSQEWSSVFLQNSFNPYKNGKILSQKMFLGQGISPDKLVTSFVDKNKKAKMTIYETLQQFIIVFSPNIIGSKDLDKQLIVAKDSDSALSLFSSNSSKYLSAKPMKVISSLLKKRKKDKVKLQGDNPIMLIQSETLINAVKSWDDRVNVFWLKGKIYLSFYKTYTKSAVAVFKSGFDWYPIEMRKKLHIKRE